MAVKIGLCRLSVLFFIMVFIYATQLRKLKWHISPFWLSKKGRDICRYETNKTDIHFETYDITDNDQVPQNMSLTCPLCLPNGFQTIHEPTGLSWVWPGQEADIIDVLFMILSSPADEQARTDIRHSWISITEANRAPRLRHMFVLGLVEDLYIQRRIDAEQIHYGDILQKDMPEGYRNITVKVVEGLRWATLHCPRAHYIMKVDTDSFVNIASLMSVISSMGPDDSWFGLCRYDKKPERNRAYRLYIPFHLYPPPIFAPFCYGGGYVLTMVAVKGILQVAPNMLLISEDVFIGLCLRELRLQKDFQHRIRDVSGFMKISPTDICADGCDNLLSAVVWHKTSSHAMECAWKRCFKQVCDGT